MADFEPMRAASPGRPRSEAVNVAVMDAVEHLLETRPFSEISIEAIASQAGVSKASIYRRWSNKSVLMVEVLKRAASGVAQKKPFEGDNYRQQLISAMKGLRSMLTSVYADAIVAVISETQKDEKLRELFFERFIAPVQEIGDAYLAAAMSRGEVRDDIDMAMIFDQMFGTFYYRLLILQKPLDDDYVERIVDNVLRQMT
jgi:AcrR family transcriptional regulator